MCDFSSDQLPFVLSLAKRWVLSCKADDMYESMNTVRDHPGFSEQLAQEQWFKLVSKDFFHAVHRQTNDKGGLIMEC